MINIKIKLFLLFFFYLSVSSVIILKNENNNKYEIMNYDKNIQRKNKQFTDNKRISHSLQQVTYNSEIDGKYCHVFSVITILNINVCLDTDENTAEISGTILGIEVSNHKFEIGETFYWKHRSWVIDIDLWAKCSYWCCRIWGEIDSAFDTIFDSGDICF